MAYNWMNQIPVATTTGDPINGETTTSWGIDGSNLSDEAKRQQAFEIAQADLLRQRYRAETPVDPIGNYRLAKAVASPSAFAPRDSEIPLIEARAAKLAGELNDRDRAVNAAAQQDYSTAQANFQKNYPTSVTLKEGEKRFGLAPGPQPSEIDNPKPTDLQHALGKALEGMSAEDQAKILKKFAGAKSPMERVMQQEAFIAEKKALDMEAMQQATNNFNAMKELTEAQAIKKFGKDSAGHNIWRSASKGFEVTDKNYATFLPPEFTQYYQQKLANVRSRYSDEDGGVPTTPSNTPQPTNTLTPAQIADINKVKAQKSGTSLGGFQPTTPAQPSAMGLSVDPGRVVDMASDYQARNALFTRNDLARQKYQYLVDKGKGRTPEALQLLQEYKDTLQR